MFKKLLFAFFILGIFISAPTQNSSAQMESSILFVAPHRVTLADGMKIQTVNVANKSSETRRYDLTVIDQVMDENGLTQRRETFDYSARRMLRFVPKRVTLKPGERQVVRIMARRPKGLADGDYHSHLLFREIPLTTLDKNELEQQNQQGDTSGKASFEIKTLYGVAVPVVVQQGQIQSDIEFDTAAYVPANDDTGKGTHIRAKFNRIGNAEAAGMFSAKFVKEGQAHIDIVKPQWIRIYREVEHVTKEIPLTREARDIDLSQGKVVLSLRKGTEEENAPIVEQVLQF